jgi:hypothetical protein
MRTKGEKESKCVLLLIKRMSEIGLIKKLVGND